MHPEFDSLTKQEAERQAKWLERRPRRKTRYTRDKVEFQNDINDYERNKE